MIYKKAEKRIDAIMAQLKGRTTHELDISRNLVWRTASTNETYGDVPAGEELKWKRIPGFPFEYGRPWTNFWFSCSVDCEGMAKDREEDLYLELLTETDTMVYLDGKPQGATNPFHPLLRLNQFIQEGKDTFEIKAESWGGHFFPGYHPSEGGRVMTAVAVKKKSYPLLLSRPRILAKNDAIWNLYYDVAVLRGLSRTLDENSLHYMKIVSVLHNSLLQLDFSCNDAELEEQANESRTLIKPLLDAKNGTISPQVISVGNAHLDHAWL